MLQLPNGVGKFLSQAEIKDRGFIASWCREKEKCSVTLVLLENIISIVVGIDNQDLSCWNLYAFWPVSAEQQHSCRHAYSEWEVDLEI